MKYLVILVAILCMCNLAYGAQTGTTLWHSHSYTDTDTDSYVDKYSEYQKKQDMALGLGLDVTVYEFTGALKSDWCLDSINTEYKYDMANGNQSVYGVVHVNAWRAIEKLIK